MLPAYFSIFPLSISELPPPILNTVDDLYAEELLSKPGKMATKFCALLAYLLPMTAMIILLYRLVNSHTENLPPSLAI